MSNYEHQEIDACIVCFARERNSPKSEYLSYKFHARLRYVQELLPDLEMVEVEPYEEFDSDSNTLDDSVPQLLQKRKIKRKDAKDVKDLFGSRRERNIPILEQLRRLFVLKHVFKHPLNYSITHRMMLLVRCPSNWFAICASCTAIVDICVILVEGLQGAGDSVKGKHYKNTLDNAILELRQLFVDGFLENVPPTSWIFPREDELEEYANASTMNFLLTEAQAVLEFKRYVQAMGFSWLSQTMNPIPGVVIRASEQNQRLRQHIHGVAVASGAETQQQQQQQKPSSSDQQAPVKTVYDQHTSNVQQSPLTTCHNQQADQHSDFKRVHTGNLSQMSNYNQQSVSQIIIHGHCIPANFFCCPQALNCHLCIEQALEYCRLSGLAPYNAFLNPQASSSFRYSGQASNGHQQLSSEFSIYDQPAPNVFPFDQQQHNWGRFGLPPPNVFPFQQQKRGLLTDEAQESNVFPLEHRNSTGYRFEHSAQVLPVEQRPQHMFPVEQQVANGFPLQDRLSNEFQFEPRAPMMLLDEQRPPVMFPVEQQEFSFEEPNSSGFSFQQNSNNMFTYEQHAPDMLSLQVQQAPSVLPFEHCLQNQVTVNQQAINQAAYEYQQPGVFRPEFHAPNQFTVQQPTINEPPYEYRAPNPPRLELRTPNQCFSQQRAVAFPHGGRTTSVIKFVPRRQNVIRQMTPSGFILKRRHSSPFTSDYRTSRAPPLHPHDSSTVKLVQIVPPLRQEPFIGSPVENQNLGNYDGASQGNDDGISQRNDDGSTSGNGNSVPSEDYHGFEPDNDDVIVPGNDNGPVPDSDDDPVPDTDDDPIPDSDDDIVPDSDEDIVPDSDDDIVPDSDEDIVPDSDDDIVPDSDEDIDSDDDPIPDSDDDIVPYSDDDIVPDSDDDIVPDSDDDIVPDSDDDPVPDNVDYMAMAQTIDDDTVKDCNLGMAQNDNDNRVPEAIEQNYDSDDSDVIVCSPNATEETLTADDSVSFDSSDGNRTIEIDSSSDENWENNNNGGETASRNKRRKYRR